MVDKKFIITGGSSGVGKKLVMELSKSNSVDALFYQNNLQLENNSNLKTVNVNLLDEDAISEYVDSIKNTQEEIVFIHAAAINSNKLITEISKEDLENIFNINLFSAFYFAKKLIPMMMGLNKGSFIFFSSAVTNLQITGTSAYSASKVSLEQLSSQIVGEYSKFGIRSNVIKLGYFNTGLINKISPQIFSKILNRIPSKELGEIEEIIKIVELLVDSKYINGSVITIDGGIK